MRVVIDIEANGKDNPTKIWIICCLDIDTGELHTFRRVSDDKSEQQKFLHYCNSVTMWIGHNIIGYDFIHLQRLLGFTPPSLSSSTCIDTLIVSKLNNYN